jgi:hypothetical protein
LFRKIWEFVSPISQLLHLKINMKVIILFRFYFTAWPLNPNAAADGSSYFRSDCPRLQLRTTALTLAAVQLYRFNGTWASYILVKIAIITVVKGSRSAKVKTQVSQQIWTWAAYPADIPSTSRRCVAEVKNMPRVVQNPVRPDFSMNELVTEAVTNLFHNTPRDETGLSVSDHQAAFMVTDTISSTSPESNFRQLPVPFKTISYNFYLKIVSFIQTQAGSL